MILVKYIPGEILNKPGLLNEIEFSLIKIHTQSGYDILRSIDFPWPVAEYYAGIPIYYGRNTMRYIGQVFRPPSEANSLLIQATIGCPHNKCSFCPMYKSIRFRIRPVEEIKKDIETAKEYYGDAVRSMFFPDGNTILMRTEQLNEIFEFSYMTFPHLERITVYGSAKFINLKSLDELKNIAKSGLGRIHSGIESGDDEVLAKINKGVNSNQVIEAGKKIKEAGIELSEYIMVGIGGKSRWKEHAENSAIVLNQINPDFIRLRTTVPVQGTPLFNEFEKDEFELLNPYEALNETKLLIEKLEVNSLLLSDHVSNFWDIHGKLPEDREKMLSEIEYALTLDESNFRPNLIFNL